MRSEKEMLDLILGVAGNNDLIRAVLLNGSRVNPNARRDVFQDYDVVYLVTDIEPFRQSRSWIDIFGERIISQTPENMRSPAPVGDGRFSYLMLFADGNRIDLTLLPLASFALLPRDSLTLLLLDKDQALGKFPKPSERDYLPGRPSHREFSDCCNEFWWVSTYVAKALWRDEILDAKRIIERSLREELTKMLAWQVAIRTDFSQNLGSYGSHIERKLEPELRSVVLSTYSDATYERTWDSLFAMCALFRTLATTIAGQFSFEYPCGDDERVSAHLQHIRRLPKDASRMY